jgi:hypothetical protein
MDPEKLKAAIAALEAADGDAALSILRDMLVALAGAAAGDAGADAGAADDAALADNADAPPPAAGDTEEEKQAALAKLKKITGKASLGEAVSAFETLSAMVSKLDADARALDLSSRRELVSDLVKLGVEFPSTAWKGEPEKREPCARLMAEPLDELRARVALHKANPRTPAGTKPRLPPASTEGKLVKTSRGEIMLSAREVKNCSDLGASLEQYAENKMAREAAREKR